MTVNRIRIRLLFTCLLACGTIGHAAPLQLEKGDHICLAARIGRHAPAEGQATQKRDLTQT